jgi:hypothetical protein
MKFQLKILWVKIIKIMMNSLQDKPLHQLRFKKI